MCVSVRERKNLFRGIPRDSGEVMVVTGGIPKLRVVLIFREVAFSLLSLITLAVWFPRVP